MSNGGGGSRRNQIIDNEIIAETGSKGVGIRNSFNGPGQAGLDVASNRVVARERAKNVGIQGVCNTDISSSTQTLGNTHTSSSTQTLKFKLLKLIIGKEGGGGSRNRIVGIGIIAEPGSENVGIQNSFNGPRQGVLNFSGNGVSKVNRSKGGRDRRRNQIIDNEIIAETGSKGVGIRNSFNGPGQADLYVAGNRVDARKRAKNVGIQGVGNTNSRPDEGSSWGCCIL